PVHLHEFLHPSLREIGSAQELEDQGSQVTVEVAEDGLPLGLALLREGLAKILSGHLLPHPQGAQEVAQSLPEEEGDREGQKRGGEGDGPPSRKEEHHEKEQGEEDPAHAA